MKRLVMALLVLVLMGGSVAAAEDNYAVETMLQRCELALAVLTRDGTYEQRTDAGNCLGFLAGVSRSMTSYAWLDFDVCRFLSAFRASGADLATACAWVEDTARYGRVEKDSRDRVVAFREKGDEPGRPGLVNAGIYLFSQAALTRLSQGEARSLERDFLQHQTRGMLLAYATQGAFVDIGTPESLARAASVMARPDSASGTEE